MSFLHAIILGVVEGLTEFLPVSSTGHLILVSHFLKIADTDFIKSFEIIIQLGAILAVVVLYWRRFLQSRKLWGQLIVGFIPTAAIGFVLYSFIKTYLLGNVSVVIAALFLGGIALILFENTKKSDGARGIETLTYKEAFVIGLAQSIALIPGVSRAAATIIAGRAQGLSRSAAVEFSFLLSVPVMVAASGLDIIKHRELFSSGQAALVVGFITAFVVAMISIVGLLRFVKRHDFVGFGIYRIIIALCFFSIFFI